MKPEQRALLRGLYAVTPDDRLLPRLSAMVSMVLRGGGRIVQYRNKSAPPPLRRAQAAELLRICRAVGALLIVNDDLPMALEIGADGVHLGAEDGDLAAARAALGPDRILGVSCYNDLARGAAAAQAGADYLAFGSVFPSLTKPDAVHAPLSLLTEARRRFALPLGAIGGINLDNADQVRAAGADMVAVITDLFDAMDVSARAEAFQGIFFPDAAAHAGASD